MDHLVIPLDRGHRQALGDLVHRVAAAAGVVGAFEAGDPHVTLVAYSGISRTATRRAIGDIARATAPFTIHAHGYGFFSGDEPSDLSLHIPVVRCHALDGLHRRLCAALCRAGGEVAAWSAPALWSPHVTLLDRCLDAQRLGDATAWLARRHHASWRIPVDRVALLDSWPANGRPGDVIHLGTRARAVPAVAEERQP